MTRFFFAVLVSVLAVAPVFAQTPAGWQVRADRSTSATDPDGAGDIKFTTIPGGFRANNPTAAIYWNPANTAKGNYTLRGTFKLLEPSGHNNFYGLFVAVAPSRGWTRTISTSSSRRTARSSFASVRAIACPIRMRRREAAAAAVRRR